MAAEGNRRRYPTKRELWSSGGEVSTADNPRKRLKKEDYSSLRSGSTIVESKGNCRKGGESENSPDSLKKTSSSLRFSPLPQEKLKQIYEQVIYIPDSLNFEVSVKLEPAQEYIQ
ncbi:hypothetical protein ABFA07_008702 [Porites harrisoni]